MTDATNITAPQPQEQNGKPQHTQISGRFNQFTSGYWALALPALAARYVARYFEKLFNIEKNVPKMGQFYAVAVGGWMAGITTMYAYRTWRDMKHVFAETLAYEFDKKPEDVTFKDFRNSKNELVQRTLTNFVKYNARRYAVSSTFFANFLPLDRFKKKDGKPIFDMKNADSVDLGVGVAGGYLVHDVMFRKITFFEALQSFIDNKINHTEMVGQVITENDLINLYAIHARDSGPGPRTMERADIRMDTVGWKNEQKIFQRMADLMNQTYHNKPATEKADFTIPKLIYLLGNGLLKKEYVEQSLGFIEIANDYGMQAVKQVEKAMRSGMTFEQAAEPFPYKEIPLPVPKVSHVERLNKQVQKNTAMTEQRTV